MPGVKSAGTLLAIGVIACITFLCCLVILTNLCSQWFQSLWTGLRNEFGLFLMSAAVALALLLIAYGIVFVTYRHAMP